MQEIQQTSLDKVKWAAQQLNLMNQIPSEENQSEPTTFCFLLEHDFAIPAGPQSIEEVLLVSISQVLLLSNKSITIYNLLSKTITSKTLMPSPACFARLLPPNCITMLSPSTCEIILLDTEKLAMLPSIHFAPLQTKFHETISYGLVTWAEKPNIVCLTQKVYINTWASFYNRSGELLWTVELRGIGMKYGDVGYLVSYTQRIQNKIQLQMTSEQPGDQQTYSIMGLPQKEFAIVDIMGIDNKTMLIGANQQKVQGVKEASSWMILDLQTAQTKIIFRDTHTILNVLFIDPKRSLLCFTQPGYTGAGYCRQMLVLLNYKTNQIFKKDQVKLYLNVTEYRFRTFVTYDSQIEEDGEDLKLKIFRLTSKESLYINLLKTLQVPQRYGQLILHEVLDIL